MMVGEVLRIDTEKINEEYVKRQVEKLEKG